MLLEDDKGMFAADNVFPWRPTSWSPATAPTSRRSSRRSWPSSPPTDLVEMNKRYEVDRDDAEDIAHDWLDDHGFGGDE